MLKVKPLNHGLVLHSPKLLVLRLKVLMYPMLVHLYFLKLLLICIVGVKIQLLLLNFNLTAKTDSQNVKVHTSMLFNLSNITHVPQTLVSTYTHLLFAQKNTNHLEVATSPELITPPFNWFFPPQLSVVQPLLRSVSTPLLTTSFV